MAEHLPAGATIYQTGKPFGHALLPGTLTRFRMGARKDEGGEGSHLPDYLVVHRHPLIASKVHDHIEELLATEYELVRAFPAMAPSQTERWFDRMDAFYLPLRGFHGIVRPGPNTEIHVRKGGNRP